MAQSHEGNLTKPEVAVLQRACNGMTDEEIAADLELDFAQVESMLGSAKEKLKAADRTHAVANALRKRLIA
ncbi:LuxR C-terminal-related transcriptional regulator [Methylobacterium nodulans]|uniref:Transcriptional regulator, LuxR family n=1 Tax=Methylobacterium nodulans (strain LMG 21967 / CNCM I-2342 / ORS 2060) TaxID=460265 RepID=B8IHR5_METNO|nr:LuxR C-terminal-related transcriptional regulator [Methylobacterium nodulans]ACL55953.1 transcriptional regulator, LuxR family [Methylobacterium nodulans ORS 2060]